MSRLISATPIILAKVNPETVSACESEDDFVALGLELLKEVAGYVHLAACTVGRSGRWSRNKAVVGGNVVRLFKLLTAFLDQTCRKRGEIAAILARLIFETSVNLQYLVGHFSADLAASYVHHSSRSKRPRWGIGWRGDEEQSLVGCSADTNDDQPTWGGLCLDERAEAIGWAGPYAAMFDGLTGNVRGGWQDLLDHHLEADGNGGFLPLLDWCRPQAQPLFALGMLILDVVSDVLGFLGDGQVPAGVTHRLADLDGQLRRGELAHEHYVYGKAAP